MDKLSYINYDDTTLMAESEEELKSLLMKMGLIKDRNVMDLTEAEDIKKRWQEYTEDVSPLRISSVFLRA